MQHISIILISLISTILYSTYIYYHQYPQSAHNDNSLSPLDKNNMPSTQQIFKQFTNWMKMHNRQYSLAQQQAYRFDVFRVNYLSIWQHNLRADLHLESYYMGVNLFSDVTGGQFNNQYLLKLNHNPHQAVTAYTCTGTQPPDREVPDAFDWVTKSAVSPIKDQAPCSTAAYAIATIESIESARFISSGKMIQLSAQQILDCSSQFGNHGCIRGNATATFGYIRKVGLASQKKYPYKGFAYNCTYSNSLKETEILGCVKVIPQKQASIKNAVHRQPLVAGINGQKIKSYSKGVFQISNPLLNHCKTESNHWMLLVGYGRDEQLKKNYWKLKNSWGISWGAQGYLLIVRKGDGEGECGVQSQLYYPIA